MTNNFFKCFVSLNSLGKSVNFVVFDATKWIGSSFPHFTAEGSAVKALGLDLSQQLRVLSWTLNTRSFSINKFQCSHYIQQGGENPASLNKHKQTCD